MNYSREDKIKQCMIVSLILLFVSALFTILVTKADVSAIGPDSTKVGFSKLNGSVRDALPYNNICYLISKLLGLLALATVAFFAFLAFLQVISRKGIFKADKDLYVLGCFYVLVLMAYVIFEKLALNFRPIDLGEGLEASYPSSHTMLGICVFITAAMQFKTRLADKNVRMIVIIACVALAVLLVVTRLLSGVHWFTDIIGGIIISSFLISLYKLGFYAVFTGSKD